MSAKSRRKGAAGEREWRDFLREHGYSAIRGCQNAGGPDTPDVKTELDGRVHFEVKRVETFRLWDSVTQATDDAGGAIPVVAHRPNRREWIVVLHARDFLSLLRQTHPPAEPLTEAE